MNINERIMVYLHRNKIRQKHLAEKTGIKITRMSNILNGVGKMTAEELRLICLALDVTADMFVNDEAWQ